MNPDWLEKLSTDDPLAAQEVALRHLGELSARGAERFQWLVAVDTALRPHADMLTERYVGTRRLPAEDKVRIWEAGYELHNQLALAYRTSLRDLSDRTVPVTDAPALVARALYHHARAATWCHFRYVSVPVGWWLNTHKLYALAERENFATKPVSLYNNDAPASCSSLYMKMLLLDTPNRTNMTERQIETLDHWLQPWSVQTELEREYREDEQQFFVDLSLDQGGRRIRNFEPTPDRRYWGTDTIISEIESLLDNGDSENPEDCLEPEILRQLHTEWSRTSYRRQRRVSDRDEVIKQAAVANGIYAVCQEVRSQAVGGPTVELEGELWRIENESLYGFGAEVRTELNAWLKVGRLIALREEMNMGMSMIGVVRSLKHYEEGKVYVGVEVLSHMALYGSLQDMDGTVPGSQSFPGVYLSSDDERGQPSSLLLPAIEYQPGAELHLRVDRRVHHIRLSRLMEQKDDWVRVEVEVLG